MLKLPLMECGWSYRAKTSVDWLSWFSIEYSTHRMILFLKKSVHKIIETSKTNLGNMNGKTMLFIGRTGD